MTDEEYDKFIDAIIDEQIKEQEERPIMFRDYSLLKFKISFLNESLKNLQENINSFEVFIEEMRLRYSDDENDKQKVILKSNEILENDFIRWLCVGQCNHRDIAFSTMREEDLKVEISRQTYKIFLKLNKEKKPTDALSVAAEAECKEICKYLSFLVQRRVNKENISLHLKETIQHILNRNWMQKREDIKIKIQSGTCSDVEAINLVADFDLLTRNPPILK